MKFLDETLLVYTVLPALRVNSCIAIDRLMIELLDFHIPFLLLAMQVSRAMETEQKAENHSTSIDFNTFSSSASEASHSLGCSMINRAVYIYMVESVHTYVSNTHAHVRMSVCY